MRLSLFLLLCSLASFGADDCCPRRIELERVGPGMPTLDAVRNIRRLYTDGTEPIVFLGSHRTGKTIMASRLGDYIENSVCSTYVLSQRMDDVTGVRDHLALLRKQSQPVKILVIEAEWTGQLSGIFDLDFTGVVVFLNLTSRDPVRGDETRDQTVAVLETLVPRTLAERLAPRTVLFPVPPQEP